MLAHARTGRGTTHIWLVNYLHLHYIYTYNLDHSATKSATHVHHSCSTHGYHLCSPNSSQTHHNIHNILLLQFWHATPVQADQMTYHPYSQGLQAVQCCMFMSCDMGVHFCPGRGVHDHA